MKYRKPRARGSESTVGQTVEQQTSVQNESPKVADGADAFAPTIDTSPDAFARTESQDETAPAQSDDTQEIPPSLYARFEAFELLGRGGMGVVYKARDLRLGRDVAVKLLFGADPQMGGSLLREARAQARIVHENVCEVYEAGTVDQVRFIVMQLIRGESLDKAKESMTLEEKVRVIRQVADALHEAHRLGMVHRDVKPANIMLERGEDGAWKPYIMDFGLARDVGDSGQTVSGALMGTPSFMAPEQAEGKVRSLDRRTDVYCLGATLYDVIAGRPPHVADGLAPLLQAIMFDEPLSPRQIDKEVPLDLDAIVMRCISKHPAGRYESAKALGEDLQRFLDGEPVAALRRARLYAWWRLVKRHKIKLTIGAVAFVVTTVFVGGWLRARHKAEVQANLSRELGESVKEMEFFLRNAHGLPLHDLERERAIVRRRLMDVEATMHAAGDIGLGPGHYALGRGHFALQEPGQTIEHLKRAEAAGYHSAGLDYALGVALTEMYQKELVATKRMSGEQKKQRLAKLDEEYKKPALARLAAALGGGLETPAYAEGLIAFYEERYEDALAKARQAFEAAPWFYEAKKLEGDALFALGRKFGHDAAFDFDKMSKWFGEADTAYQTAAEIGRSDPNVHTAICELQTQVMCAAYAHADPMRPAFDAANVACDKAIVASPSKGAGYATLADVHAQFAWRVASGQFPGENPEQALTDATKHAEEATRRNPEDAVAHYVVGAAWRARALYEVDRGLNEGPASDRAIAAYESALKIEPTFLWALNEQGSSFHIRAEREIRHDVDPMASITAGVALCQKAIDIDPNFTYAKMTALNLKIALIRQQVTLGRWPSAEIPPTNQLIEQARSQAPTSTTLHWRIVDLAQLELSHAIDAGLETEKPLSKLQDATEHFGRLSPSSTAAKRFQGDLAAFRVRIAVERGIDPSDFMQGARDAFEEIVRAAPWDLGYRVRQASVEVWALRWALRRTKVTNEQFDAARAPLLPLIDIQRDDPRLYAVLGEIDELRAKFLIAEKREPTRAISDALEYVERALKIHPRMTTALACKGRLLLLHVHQEANASRKREIAEKAHEAFKAAMKANPLVERREKAGIEEARHYAESH